MYVNYIEPERHLSDWEMWWQPAVRKKISIKLKSSLFSICILFCSPPASAQPKVNPFSKQWWKAEASSPPPRPNSIITLVNDFPWVPSVMYGEYVTAAVVAATRSLFNLILSLFFFFFKLFFFICLLVQRAQGGNWMRNPREFQSQSMQFFPLQRLSTNPIALLSSLHSSTYETTFVVIMPTSFSHNTLASQVLQPLLFSSKA